MLTVNMAAETVEHWSFQPVRPVDPAPLRDSSWVKTPVDGFVLAGLNAAGLNPSPPTTREQLIRRVSLDLIGLPPTPEEVQAFLAEHPEIKTERLPAYAPELNPDELVWAWTKYSRLGNLAAANTD